MFNSVNTCWVLVAAFLVYFMQAGFALCEAGFTRAKNTGNILMKNMMDFCIGTPCYWLIGFGLMFGGTSALTTALEFLMSAEIAKTFLLQNLESVVPLAATFALRALMSLLLHIEMRGAHKE